MELDLDDFPVVIYGRGGASAGSRLTVAPALVQKIEGSSACVSLLMEALVGDPEANGEGSWEKEITLYLDSRQSRKLIDLLQPTILLAEKMEADAEKRWNDEFVNAPLPEPTPPEQKEEEPSPDGSSSESSNTSA